MPMSIEMAAPLEIGLCVSDMATSLAFYRDGLGLTLVSDLQVNEDKARASGLAASAYRVIRLQAPFGERIKLFAPVSAEPAAKSQQPPLAACGFAFLTIIVADLRASLPEIARRCRVPSIPAPVELRPRTWVSLIRDPDEIPVELVSYDDLAAYRPDLAGRAAFAPR
jgi:catechol 2,3-dioxygenase-like lactoylglutathione lyase family enzyme